MLNGFILLLLSPEFQTKLKSLAKLLWLESEHFGTGFLDMDIIWFQNDLSDAVLGKNRIAERTRQFLFEGLFTASLACAPP